MNVLNDKCLVAKSFVTKATFSFIKMVMELNIRTVM